MSLFFYIIFPSSQSLYYSISLLFSGVRFIMMIRSQIHIIRMYLWRKHLTSAVVITPYTHTSHQMRSIGRRISCSTRQSSALKTFSAREAKRNFIFSFRRGSFFRLFCFTFSLVLSPAAARYLPPPLRPSGLGTPPGQSPYSTRHARALAGCVRPAST